MDFNVQLHLMPNPYALRFAVMARRWEYWLVTTGTLKLMMDAVLHAQLTQAINVVEEQYLLQIFALKFAETEE